MKYLDIFKKWYFWVLFLVDMVYSIKYIQPVLIAEWMGFIIGSFIKILIIFSVGYGLYLIIKKIKGKKKNGN